MAGSNRSQGGLTGCGFFLAVILVVAVVQAAVQHWLVTAAVAGVAAGAGYLLRRRTRLALRAPDEGVPASEVRQPLPPMPPPPPPSPRAPELRDDRPLEERKEAMLRRMSAFNEQVLGFLRTYGSNPDEWRARWQDRELPALVAGWEALTPEFIAIGEAIIEDEALRKHPQVEELWVGDLVEYFALVDRTVQSVRTGAFHAIMADRPLANPEPEETSPLAERKQAVLEAAQKPQREVVPRLRREPIPERVRNEVWRRDEGRCVDCGSRERLEYDHIIPFSKGGSNTARNLELRCEACNRRKGARI